MRFLVGFVPFLVAAQLPQNPSPMQEHTRAHPRLEQQTLAGRREPLSLGTLFIPAKLDGKSSLPLLVFFHGGSWVPEVAAARNGSAAISVQIGAGSGVYVRAFQQGDRLGDLIREAESKSGKSFSRITVGGWSAGCGALREIVKSASYERTGRVLCIDGIHSGYVNGNEVEPGPLESWVKVFRDAMAGKKRVIVTH